jgi:uncharacterized membrane protein
MKPTRVVATLVWSALFLSSLAIAGYAAWGYGARPLGSLVHPKMGEVFRAHPVAIYAHVFFSLAALALGPIQLVKPLRRRRPGLHRAVGRVYLFCVLVGGLAGLRLAPMAFGGAFSAAGFAALAIGWLATGFLGYKTIRRGDVAAHRRWMLRNYALTFAAVTLRLQMGICFALGLPFEAFYPWLAWTCWVPNALVGEWMARNFGPK